MLLCSAGHLRVVTVDIGIMLAELIWAVLDAVAVRCPCTLLAMCCVLLKSMLGPTTGVSVPRYCDCACGLIAICIVSASNLNVKQIDLRQTWVAGNIARA